VEVLMRTYKSLEQTDEALALGRECLEGTIQALGEQHPDALRRRQFVEDLENEVQSCISMEGGENLARNLESSESRMQIEIDVLESPAVERPKDIESQVAIENMSSPLTDSSAGRRQVRMHQWGETWTRKVFNK
jgi:Tetratricopeptide repeat